MESVQLATRKIRIYPKNELKFKQALSLFRRAYNLATACYINDEWRDEDGKAINLRPSIKQVCRAEQLDNGGIYNSIIVDNAVLKAKETFLKIIKCNKSNKTNHSMSFKSRKHSRQTFAVDRLSVSKMVAPRAIGEFDSAEQIGDESINKSCSISFERGRWYIQVLTNISTAAEIQGDVRCIAIDPGVRTFATGFSDNEVIEFGRDFAKKRLLPLALKYRKLISIRAKLLKLDSEEIWVKERLASICKKIWKLENKKQDLVLDMHHRLAYYLVSNYDLVFLPTFETKKMTRKNGRRINRSTTRAMLDLSHYKFKMLLKWYAKKYGKHVVDCNESYTSKTISWSGVIDNKLGSKKTIKDKSYVVGRDINAARGILIKQLSMAA
jgi:putative transposase